MFSSTMFDSNPPKRMPLGDNLVLTSVGSVEDAGRLAAFNKAIHGDGVDSTTYQLITQHPNTRPDYWPFIEDESTGEIVSALCLIPWTWRYEDVTLKVGEMGIVGTAEAYRSRGLIRKLDGYFKDLLRSGEFVLSQIQGIPYFYRQLGYEYALPLQGGWQLELRSVPDADAEELAPYRFRRATPDDIPVLQRLYDTTAHDLSITTVRDADIWRFLLTQTSGSETEGEFWLVLDHDGQAVGYWLIALHDFGIGLNVPETSRLSSEAAAAVLRYLKTLAVKRDKPFMRLYGYESSAMLQTARTWGAHKLNRYAWQIYLPDVRSLLHQLGPVFERRLAGSPFAGMTRRVRINLYREAFDMRFEAGTLSTVEAAGFCEGGDINLPPNLLAPLVLGHRTRAELASFYPDVGRGQSEYLIDCLFPRVEAIIYTIY